MIQTYHFLRSARVSCAPVAVAARLAALALACAVGGCAPQDVVVQRAGMRDFHESYRYLGVSCERSDVRVRAWSADSVAMAVTMPAAIRPHYSFLVDSVADSLTLVGHVGDAIAPEAPRAEVALAVPRDVDCTVRASGSVSVTDVRGPLTVFATDSVIAALGNGGGAVHLTSTRGTAVLEFPADAALDLDLQAGPGAAVTIEHPGFHGTTEPGRARGRLGTGGPAVEVHAARGIEIIVR